MSEQDSTAEIETHAKPRLKHGFAFAHLAFLISLIAPLIYITVMLSTGVGYIDYNTGFIDIGLGLIPKMAMGAMVIALLSLLISIFMAPLRTGPWALVAIMISGGMLAGYYVYETRMKTYPPIHDVATNWERPVTFSRMLIEQRGPEANPIEDNPYVAKGVSYEWKGQSVAAVNLETCPQAKGILNKKVTADQVVTILKAENYQVVGRSDWRIEATYEDPFWGWKSDVVVRLDPGRIDLRSVSREAQADLGGNCRRITRLVNLIKAA